jgi:hypothetical protein
VDKPSKSQLPRRSSTPSSNGTKGKLFSFPVPDAVEKDGEGIPRRHPIALDNNGLLETFDPSVKTLFDCFQRSLEQFGRLSNLALSPLSGFFLLLSHSPYFCSQPIVLTSVQG